MGRDVHLAPGAPPCGGSHRFGGFRPAGSSRAEAEHPPADGLGSGRAEDARRTPFSPGALGARLAPCFPQDRMVRRQLTSESRRFPPSWRQLPRPCVPPAACWRCRPHAWYRPPTAAMPASVAATSVLRRAGRPRRRHLTKGSPPPLLGSTTPPTQRGWQDGGATKRDGPSRRCFAHPRTPRRDEPRHRRATSSARRSTRARGRPLERGRAHRARRPTRGTQGGRRVSSACRSPCARAAPRLHRAVRARGPRRGWARSPC